MSLAASTPCPALEVLDRYAGGELSDAGLAVVQRHLAGCGDCRDRAAELDALFEIAASARRVRARTACAATVPPLGEWAPEGYELLRILHRGGQAVVLEALQSRTGRRVALKVLREDKEASLAARLRFQRELELVRELEHPAIVPVYDGGREHGRQFLVMRLIDGVSLASWLKEQRPPLRTRLRLFAELCDGIHHAHQQGVIHRDLKPSNVLVDAEGRPHILDFGIARRIEIGEDASEGDLTLTGEFAGTLPFASPEQLRGVSRLDVRTDVYSLGVLLYHLVTGIHPFEAKSSVAELVLAIEQGHAAPPSQRTPDADRELDAIVAKAMAPERERRYQSAETLRDDLLRYLRHEPVAARGASFAYLSWKMIRRHRLAAALAITLLLSLGGAAWLGLRIARLENERRRDAEAAAERAREERDALDTAVEEWQQLADTATARALLQQTDELFPISEAIVPRCDAWLAAAAELVAKGVEHRRVVDALRIRGEPVTFDGRRRMLPELFFELDELRSLLGQSTPEGKPVLSPRRRDALRERVEQLEAQIQEAPLWRFAEAGEQWRHDVLCTLLGDLEKIDERRAEIRSRRELAASLRKRSIDEGGPALERCARDLAADPRFRGFSLAPRSELVPLRSDPQSGFWEFWHVPSGERPRPDPGGKGWEMRSATGLVLVLLPGGSFTMGARLPEPGEGAGPNVDPWATDLSTPVHTVELAPFMISKYEVTEGQWLRYFRELPPASEGGPAAARARREEARPVTGVTWDAAFEACRRFGLALPTESQWELACRAGTSTVWFTGDLPGSLNGYANVYDAGSFPSGIPHMGRPTPGISDGHTLVAPVGAYAPNPFGLHDMSGNLAEWCLDRMHATYELPWRAGDGLRHGLPDCPYRAKRGGSYGLTALRAASATRGSDTRDTADRFTGFRPVLALGLR